MPIINSARWNRFLAFLAVSTITHDLFSGTRIATNSRFYRQALARRLAGTAVAGFYLLEILITMIITAISMLGIAAMLIIAHKASSSSYLYQQAVQSAYNIIDKMRANRQAAINGSYNISDLVTSGAPSLPAAPAQNCASTTCTPTALATYDSWYWLTNDVGQLPNGAGSITTTVNGTNTLVSIVIQWNDNPAQAMLGTIGQTSSTNASITQFSTGTSL